MQFSQRHADIVIVRPPSTIDRHSLLAMLTELEWYLARRSPYALLFDLSAAGMPSPADRSLLAGHIRDHRAAIEQWVRGIAFVTDSGLLRGAVTAVLWISPMPIPHQAFATVAEAEAWLQQCLREPARAPRPG